MTDRQNHPALRLQQNNFSWCKATRYNHAGAVPFTAITWPSATLISPALSPQKATEMEAPVSPESSAILISRSAPKGDTINVSSKPKQSASTRTCELGALSLALEASDVAHKGHDADAVVRAIQLQQQTHYLSHAHNCKRHTSTIAKFAILVKLKLIFAILASSANAQLSQQQQQKHWH